MEDISRLEAVRTHISALQDPNQNIVILR